MERETKLCPFCGGEILAVAKKCKHCGRWLEERPVQSEQPMQLEQPTNPDVEKRWFIGIGVGIVLILAVIFIATASKNSVINENEEVAQAESEWQDDLREDISDCAIEHRNDAYLFEEQEFEEEGEDVEEYMPYTSPDLCTLFLHGYVRTMVEYREDQAEFRDVYVFDMDGNLVRYQNKYNPDEDDSNKIIRKNGRIACLGEDTYAAISVTEFVYSNDGKCISTNCHSGHGTNEYVFTSYDDYGCPTFARKSGAYCHMDEDEDWTGTASFSYSAYDGEGNWTRCVRNDKDEVVCRIYDDEGNLEVVNETRNTKTVIIREITYY